jgi:hypothetical protein
MVGQGHPSERNNFLYHSLGRVFGGNRTVDGAAHVVHHHTGTAPRELKSVTAPDASPCSGDERNVPVEPQVIHVIPSGY